MNAEEVGFNAAEVRLNADEVRLNAAGVRLNAAEVGLDAAVVAVLCVLCVLHTFDDIDPGQSLNIDSLVAFEFTQAAPQSLMLKADALLNIEVISVTVDTSHFDRS